MEVLKVKVGFKKPISGSIPGSPNIYIYITLLSLKQLKVKVHLFKNKRINCRFLKIIHCSNNSVTSEKCIMYINSN